MASTRNLLFFLAGGGALFKNAMAALSWRYSGGGVRGVLLNFVAVLRVLSVSNLETSHCVNRMERHLSWQETSIMPSECHASCHAGLRQ